MPVTTLTPGRAWLAALPDELEAQRRVMTGLLDRCENWPLATSLLVGCSLGRGAADALSDIDAALGVDAPPGEAGAGVVGSVEAMVVAALPDLGTVVDVLRHRTGPADQHIRRIFAQFADGTQLDLAVVAQAGVDARLHGGGAPDFVPLYQTSRVPASDGEPGEPGESGAAYAVTGEQVREWAFHGWCALIDVDKYLRRGSPWEAHGRLHEARHHIWALWAAARGALYPWHGLSQVLDHDPADLPPGIESTVAGLDADGLRRAARAAAEVLVTASEAAARRHPAGLPADPPADPSVGLPVAMAAYVTSALARNALLGTEPASATPAPDGRREARCRRLAGGAALLRSHLEHPVELLSRGVALPGQPLRRLRLRRLRRLRRRATPDQGFKFTKHRTQAGYARPPPVLAHPELNPGGRPQAPHPRHGIANAAEQFRRPPERRDRRDILAWS